MKTVFSTLIVAAVSLLAVNSAEAQKIGSSSSLQISLEDAIYDFQVYAAEDPGTGYYIVWEMSDGSLLKYGPYSSYDYAFNRLTRILMGGWEPDGYVDVDILQLPIPPNYMLFDTVGTRAEAEQLTSFLQTFGLLTKIKRVSTLQLNY